MMKVTKIKNHHQISRQWFLCDSKLLFNTLHEYGHELPSNKNLLTAAFHLT